MGSQLEASDAAPIVEICRRLDGIPLAIELAAARVVALSPPEIAGLLDERFRLLTGGRRASLERHHTLRAAVDWSYSLLGDIERLVFDRLGVFPSSFDAGAAQAVAGEEIEPWDVIDALSSLVAKSMLVADRTPSGSTRYQMLETLRHYARERLDAARTADACRRRHAQHYADFACKAREGTRSEDDLLWWSRMQTEIDNLRAAALWALDSRVDEDGDVALRIISDLTAGSFEELAGVFSWAEQAVERAERAAPELRSAVLGAASMSAWYRADYVRAHRLARDALGDAIPAGSLSPELPFMALMLSGRPDRIRGVLADGLAALDAVGADPLSRFRLHSAAAGSAAQTGDLEFAAAVANETLRIGRQLSHRFVIMVGLYLVALTSWRTAPDDALAALEENFALGESFSANWRGRALALAAQLRAGKGDADGAISALRQAITECHRSGERTGVATAFDRGIQVLAATRHHEMAAVFGGDCDRRGLRQHPRHSRPRTARSSTRARTPRSQTRHRALRRCGCPRRSHELRRGPRLNYPRARRAPLPTRAGAVRTTEEQAAVPSGVVTFLFTDIEGSTRRWEADADAMRAALEAHDTVLREAIEGHAGWLFKHTGDGVCAAFTSPRSAVDAAVTAQRALELPVRMGISTGEAELRGSDYFGAVLNRAARSRTTSRLSGPKNSSNPPGPSTILDSQCCIWGHRIAGWRDGSRPLSTTATPARRRCAVATTGCRMAPWPGSGVRTSPMANLDVGRSSAAVRSQPVATRTHLSRHRW
jgi:hypothetical protein